MYEGLEALKPAYTSVADPDPVSGAFLTPGFGIRGGEKSGIGHPVPGPYFRELSNNFWG